MSDGRPDAERQGLPPSAAAQGGQEIIEPNRPGGGDTPPELLSRLIEIEKSRIESADKRTEMIRFGIESNIAAENLQFEFHKERLRVFDGRAKRKDRLALIIIVVSIVFGICVASFLLDQAFFGDLRQSTTAKQILAYVLAGIGGFGVLSTVRRAAKKLLDDEDDDTP
jgi:hypothetical protein